MLEAWCGARGDDALAVARELMGVAHLPGKKAPPPPPDARPPQAERTFAHGAAAVATAVLLALWAPPLTSAYGGAAVTDAVTAALPLALGLQWVLRARAVPGPRAIAHLRAGWPAVAALVASTLLLALLPIDGAAVAAGLALHLGHRIDRRRTRLGRRRRRHRRRSSAPGSGWTSPPDRASRSARWP